MFKLPSIPVANVGLTLEFVVCVVLLLGVNYFESVIEWATIDSNGVCFWEQEL